MTHVLRATRLLPAVALLLTLTAPAFAQNPRTASEFYLQYRKAFDAAKKIEDVMPYMSAATLAQVKSTPAEERPKIFEMIKMIGALTDVKIVKETRTANGATLNVEALDADKAKTTGIIDIVREGNAFKLGKESWSSGQ